jgi:hypothetical protein
MPQRLQPVPPEVDVIDIGIHVNDAPKDDPTRLLIHYDGRALPWLMFAGLVCGILGFTGGLWMGTDHYTISTACQTGGAP